MYVGMYIYIPITNSFTVLITPPMYIFTQFTCTFYKTFFSLDSIHFTVIEYNQSIYCTRLIQFYYHPTHTTSTHSLYLQHYYIVNHDGTFYTTYLFISSFYFIILAAKTATQITNAEIKSYYPFKCSQATALESSDRVLIEEDIISNTFHPANDSSNACVFLTLRIIDTLIEVSEGDENILEI